MDKKSYRVRNWDEYNKALVNRGNINFWIDEKCLKQWQSPKKIGKKGRPEKYSDTAIHCGLTLKALLKLTFRSTEGFIQGLMSKLKIDLEVPDYTLLCKRQKHLSIRLPKVRNNTQEKLDIVVDTTGIKVYGEGEWKVRQHGWKKHRLWRMLHLAVNSSTHGIEAFELTDFGTRDCEGFPLLLKKIEGPIGSCKADGAYDNFTCYEESEHYKFELITPPTKKAKTSDERRRHKKKASPGALEKRDTAIREVRKLGRKEWKIKTRYHQRSLVETAMFRIKTILGNRLTTRNLENQKVEVSIWCEIINKMTALGMPNSVAIN